LNSWVTEAEEVEQQAMSIRDSIKCIHEMVARERSRGSPGGRLQAIWGKSRFETNCLAGVGGLELRYVS
jgi:hypothetical protein